MQEIPEELWGLATWKGSRREQLRRALRLSIRERLQATEELSDVVRRFEQMRASGKFRQASNKD